MHESFAALQEDYTSCLVNMKFTREKEIDEVAHKLLRHVDEGRYQGACDATGVPQIFSAASFEREASSDFHCSAANGDRLDRRSHDEPISGPFPSWSASAIWAYRHDRLDQVGKDNWSWQCACFEGELFNGFGPRRHGKRTGYLWAGSNIYTGGKFVSDHNWNPHAEDSQLGIIPVMFRLVQLRPVLTLPTAFPATSIALTPIKAAPDGLRDAAALQAALNTIGADPKLLVDDNYGRLTRRAVSEFQRIHGIVPTGIADPETKLAISKELRAIAAASNTPTQSIALPAVKPIVVDPPRQQATEPSKPAAGDGIMSRLGNWMLRKAF